MKKHLSFSKMFISLSLMLFIALSALTSYAFADVEKSFSCREGEYFKSSDIDMAGWGISETNYMAGSLPPGLNLQEYDSYYVLEGTPGKSGSYGIQYHVIYEGGGDDFLFISVDVEAKAPPATPSPTPAASPKPSAQPESKDVKITKHPTGESVFEGGRAVFISKADNEDSFVWRIVSPDTNTTVEASDAPSYFSGLKLSGADSERLVLENIPLSMDGWKAECKFFGQGGPVYSNGAVISVTEKALAAPEISSQPQGLELKSGSTTTLSFTAQSPDNAQLHYEWYSGSSKSNSGGTRISGADSNRYQPPEKEGTVYYYAAVWASDGERTSPVSYTKAVPIKYLPKPEESAAPSPVAPSPSPDAAEPDYGGTAIGTEAEITVEPEKGGPDITVILIIILCIMLAAVLICLLVIYLKGGLKKNPPPELPPDEEYNGLHDGINDEEDYENYKKHKK